MLLLLIEVALARSCVAGPSAVNVDALVVTEAVPWVVEYDFGLDDIELVSDQGAVPFDLVDLSDQALQVVPDGGVVPGSYVLSLDGDQSLEARFQVTDEDLGLEAPDPPVYTTRRTGRPFGHGAIRLSFEEAADITHYEVQIDGASSTWISSEGDLAIGDEGCLQSFTEFRGGQGYNLQARAIGRDGQASDWVQAFSAGRACGCSSTRTPTPVLIGLLALLGLRRRAYSRSPAT